MSKNQSKRPVAREQVNNVETKKHRADREEKQKDQGNKVIMWIFLGLIILAIFYMIWTFYVIQ